MGERGSLCRREGKSPMAMGKAPEKEAIPGKAEATVKGRMSSTTTLSPQARQT